VGVNQNVILSEMKDPRLQLPDATASGGQVDSSPPAGGSE